MNNTLEEYGNLFLKLGLTEMSVKDGDFQLTLKKECDLVQPTAIVKNINVSEEKNDNAETVKNDINKNVDLEISAPLVGVFCIGEGTDSEPYVKVGDTVRKGDIVCTIEAMKMFNDVAADKDGIVKEICVKNGQLVEFGQTLFKLEEIN